MHTTAHRHDTRLRILCATDLSAASAHAAHAATQLFPAAELHFLHVCNTPFATRVALADGREDAVRVYRNQALLQAGRELDRFIRGIGLQRRRASSVVRWGYPPACIAEAANERKSSVVAFGATDRSHVDATLLGSVTASFTGGSGHDVLLVKAMRSRPGEHVRDDAGVLGTT